MCKLATRFVLGNPAQIEKRVRTVHGVNGPAVWIDFGGDDAPPSLDEALDRIAVDVLRRPKADRASSCSGGTGTSNRT